MCSHRGMFSVSLYVHACVTRSTRCACTCMHVHVHTLCMYIYARYTGHTDLHARARTYGVLACACTRMYTRCACMCMHVPVTWCIRQPPGTPRAERSLHACTPSTPARRSPCRMRPLPPEARTQACVQVCIRVCTQPIPALRTHRTPPPPIVHTQA